MPEHESLPTANTVGRSALTAASRRPPPRQNWPDKTEPLRLSYVGQNLTVPPKCPMTASRNNWPCGVNHDWPANLSWHTAWSQLRPKTAVAHPTPPVGYRYPPPLKAITDTAHTRPSW